MIEMIPCVLKAINLTTKSRQKKFMNRIMLKKYIYPNNIVYYSLLYDCPLQLDITWSHHSTFSIPRDPAGTVARGKVEMNV